MEKILDPFNVAIEQMFCFQGQYLDGFYVNPNEIPKIRKINRDGGKIQKEYVAGEQIRLTEYIETYYKNESHLSFKVGLCKFIVKETFYQQTPKVTNETLAWVINLYNIFGEKYVPFAIKALNILKYEENEKFQQQIDKQLLINLDNNVKLDEIINRRNARLKQIDLLLAEITGGSQMADSNKSDSQGGAYGKE